MGGWTYHDVRQLPAEVYDVLVAQLSQPQDDEQPDDAFAI